MQLHSQQDKQLMIVITNEIRHLLIWTITDLVSPSNTIIYKLYAQLCLKDPIHLLCPGFKKLILILERFVKGSSFKRPVSLWGENSSGNEKQASAEFVNQKELTFLCSLP